MGPHPESRSYAKTSEEFPRSWTAKVKHRVKHVIPLSVINKLLLACPWLYGTSLVNYESNLNKTVLDELLSQLDRVQHLEGNIIECGISRGGTSIILANFLRSEGMRKLIYACDSFEGFDRRELDKERKAGLALVSDSAFTYTSYEYVLSKIKKLGVYDLVVPIKGFFKDTLPHLKSEWCFAFVDCDLQESIIYCAETLWPNLLSNGRIVFDDYRCEFFRAARVGIVSFVERHKNEISDHGLINELYYVCKK
jgi:hypothetical protein